MTNRRHRIYNMYQEIPRYSRIAIVQGIYAMIYACFGDEFKDAGGWGTTMRWPSNRCCCCSMGHAILGGGVNLGRLWTCLRNTTVHCCYGTAGWGHNTSSLIEHSRLFCFVIVAAIIFGPNNKQINKSSRWCLFCSNGVFVHFHSDSDLVGTMPLPSVKSVLFFLPKPS